MKRESSRAGASPPPESDVRLPRALRAAAAALTACGLLATSGCLYSRFSSNTARSATEQLLISESIRRTVTELALPDVRDRAVAVEIRSVKTDDTDYLKAALEVRLGGAGARIVPADQAELVVVALVGGIGTVSRNAAFGLPSLPIPSVGATPEIPFLSALRQRAWSQVQVVVRDRAGSIVAASGPVMRRARFDITSVLFIEVRRNDVYPGEGNVLAIE